MFFANEPILRVTAPLPEAQLVETRLINILHFQSLIAAKAARMVLVRTGQAARRFRPAPRAWRGSRPPGRARKLHRRILPAPPRCWPSKLFGIPIYGTMAHSFVQAYDDESAAFEAFARSRPENLILLIDTYDTENGGAQGSVARASAEGRRHHGSRRAARQRRPGCSLQERAAHPGRRRTGRRDHLRERRPRRGRAGPDCAEQRRPSTASASAPA